MSVSDICQVSSNLSDSASTSSLKQARIWYHVSIHWDLMGKAIGQLSGDLVETMESNMPSSRERSHAMVLLVDVAFLLKKKDE